MGEPTGGCVRSTLRYRTRSINFAFPWVLFRVEARQNSPDLCATLCFVGPRHERNSEISRLPRSRCGGVSGGSAPRTKTLRGQSFGRFEVVAACLSAPATVAGSHEIERGKWRTIRANGRRAAGNSRLARRARAWTVRIRICRERHRFRRSARSFGCGSSGIGHRLSRPSQTLAGRDRSTKRGASAGDGGEGRGAAGGATPGDHTFCRSLRVHGAFTFLGRRTGS